MNVTYLVGALKCMHLLWLIYSGDLEYKQSVYYN